MRTVHETALLVAILLKRSKKKRGQMSSATLRRLSGRSELRSGFIEDLRRALDELGLTLIEVDRGGYVVFPWIALRGTVSITAKKYMTDLVGEKDLDLEALRRELEDRPGEDDEDEEGSDDAADSDT